MTYPYKAETVQIKIYMTRSYRLYNYFICPVRKYFVLYIDKGSIDAGEYLCHMIVNDNVILDKRYKYIVDKNNILYNLIYFGQQPLLPIKVNLKNDKKDKDKDKKKKKHKNNDIIDENDFYFYCYNDNSHSTNSLSTKSDHDKNRIKEKNNLYKISNQNKFLKQNKKKGIDKNKGIIPDFLSENKFIDINTGNISKKKICVKQRDFESYFRDLISKFKEPKPKQTISSYDYKSSEREEEDIENQKIKYSNILDELSSSISSTKSNFSMKKLNSYSKKTHRAKFSSNLSARLSSKKILFSSPYNSNTLTINTDSSFRNKIFKIKKSK